MIASDNIIFFLVLIIINILFVKNYRYFGKKINIYDLSNKKRKIHKKPVPLLGGLIIYFNILFFITYAFFKDANILLDLFLHTEMKGLLYLFIIFTIIFLIGLYDDKYKIRPLIRLIGLSILIYFMIKIDQLLLINPLNFTFSDFIITFNIGLVLFSYLCFITLLISCNMSDGINLQSAIFYLINFSILYFIEQNFIILIILFSLLIFILLNSKGKIFLGDAGAYILSILLGFYFIKYYQFQNTLKADQVFLFLFFPVLDSIRCFGYRILKGKSIFLADNIHFHHILLKKLNYIKTITILTILYLVPVIAYLFDINTFYVLTLILSTYFLLLFKLRS